MVDRRRVDLYAAALQGFNTAANLTDVALKTIDADSNSQVRQQQDARLGGTYAPGRSVKAHGAKGDGITDDTAAIQAAINAAAGGVLYLPAGDYRINVTAVAGADGSNVGLRMTNAGTTLLMHDGAKLRALASSSERYAVIEITAADCAVIGGQIVGDIGSHVGNTGEWGHGITIMEEAHRTKVERVRISKCWGDGICVGDSGVAYTTGARPADVQINNVVCDDNRRQGVSIVAALRLKINGGAFVNTGQTAFKLPGAGIAVEANAGGVQKITDLVITGAVCSRNKGRGAYFNSAGNELTATVNGVRCVDNDADGFGFDLAAAVVLNGCSAINNGVTAATSVDGFIVPASQSAPVTFNGCTATGNRRMGFITSAADTAFATCRSDGNGWAGFATTGARTKMTACSASGNNQISNFYGQFMLDGGSDAHLVGCVSEAGQGATKVGWGYQTAAATSGAQLSGCTAKGAFTAGAFLDSGTGTIAIPKPGVAKQAGTPAAAIDAATTQALVNDLRAKLLALGLVY